MQGSLIFRIATGALLVSAGVAEARPAYPTARRESISERHFGVIYHDNYRWMENLDDPGVGAWVNAQNQFTATTLGTPVDVLAQEFELILNPTLEASDIPHNLKKRRLFERFRPFADTDGLGSSTTSPSGTYSATTVTDSGSDLSVLQISDAQGNAQADVMHVKFPTIVWESETSFIYTSDRDGRLGDSTSLVRRHKIGTKQRDDTVIFTAKAAIDNLELYKIGGRLLLMEWVENKTAVYDLDSSNGNLTTVIQPSNGMFFPFDARGTKIYFTDYRQAPMGEVRTFDLATSQFATVVPTQANVLDQVVMIGNDIYITLLEDVESRLYRVNPTTQTLTAITLPGSGTAYLESGGDGSQLSVYFTSYTEKASTWLLDRSTDTLMSQGGSRTPPFPLEASKTYYTAHDGRQVPIWLVRREGTALTPQTPTYLYGYGGFSINILPALSRETLPWLKRGGVVAMATLPGGLEFGEEWHKAGALNNKRNVFDDFAAAARHLIDSGYTSSDKIAISGASNGGLLVGATANLYPTLFRAAVPEVGVMDLTKFQLFTGGKWWVDEYGDRDNRTAFLNQYALSPYHNLKRMKYPATLVMTADADDRVVPSHSYKYAARLQEYQDDSRLALIWTRHGGSHSWLTGTVKESALARAVKWAFIMQELDVQL